MRRRRDIEVRHLFPRRRPRIEHDGEAAKARIEAPTGKVAEDRGVFAFAAAREYLQENADDFGLAFDQKSVLRIVGERRTMGQAIERGDPIGPRTTREAARQAIDDGLAVAILDLTAFYLIAGRNRHSDLPLIQTVRRNCRENNRVPREAQMLWPLSCLLG